MPTASLLSALLLVPLLACDRSGDDCASLGDGADACWLERSKTLAATDPRAALDAARAVADPMARDLVMLELLTTSGAFSEQEVRRVCDNELQSAATRDRCTSWLQRPHLRVEAGSPAVAPGAEAAGPPGDPRVPTDCADATGSRADWCRYGDALGAADLAAARAAIQAIADPEVRGQAVAGRLRAARPRTAAELTALAELLPLAQGAWQAEARSLLSSELPFAVLQACVEDPARRPGCQAELDATLLPFAVDGCAQAGDLADQCFDHVCAGVTAHSIAGARQQPPVQLATAVEGAHAALVAREPRVAALPDCQRVWAGRKLYQLGGGDLAWADARCAAFDAAAPAAGATDAASTRTPPAAACRAGLAEEFLTSWLRTQPPGSAEAVAALALAPDDRLPPLPADLADALPCGALSLLTGQLAPGLGKQPPSPATLDQLRRAWPSCPW